MTPGGAEERGGGGEDVSMNREFGLGFADVDGGEFFVEGSGR